MARSGMVSMCVQSARRRGSRCVPRCSAGAAPATGSAAARGAPNACGQSDASRALTAPAHGPSTTTGRCRPSAHTHIAAMYSIVILYQPDID